MGEAKRKRVRAALEWPTGEAAYEKIRLSFLPPLAAISSYRVRAVLDDPSIPSGEAVILQTFSAEVRSRKFYVGFTLGDEQGVSKIGALVLERLAMEAPGASVHVVPVAHADIAWDIVLRHLRTFTGRILLFVFPDSEVYDAGSAEKYYSSEVLMFDQDSRQMPRLSPRQRHEIRRTKAAILERPMPPPFEGQAGVSREDAPWLFAIRTPAGKALRVAVWNGRRDYAPELPGDVHRWVGGDRVAIVQVDRPVGVDRRSSLALTHWLSSEFDGVVHWARDTETFQSIVSSFVRLDIPSAEMPDIEEPYSPSITILAANPDDNEE